MKKVMALMALTILTACDPDSRSDLRAEQNDRLYKEAMEDYRSGRMDAAVKGFEKLMVKDPANASARFQFACLLQDVRRDFAAAYCAYREYLLQRPESDKAKLARDRMAMCEKELARKLADRYGLGGTGASSEEVENLRKQLKAAEARVAASEKNLAESLKRIRVLSDEKDRLQNVVNGVGGGATETAAARPSAKEVRELLEEDDESAPLTSPAGEFASLVKDEEDGEAAQSSLLPKQTAAKASEKAEKKDGSSSEKAKAALPERPKTYVVQEGDTLYGVAKRFYGTLTVWKQIRDANKAVISTDNRLRAGDTIVLPEP